MIRVEFYEGARRITGVPSVEVEATTLGEALDAVRRRFPGLEGRVIVGDRLAPHWRASLGGRVFVDEPTTPLEANESVLLVSALAGG